MRLPRPRSITLLKRDNPKVNTKSLSRRLLGPVLFLLILAIAVIAVFHFRYHKTITASTEDANSTIIRFEKNSKRPEDQRITASAYMAQSNYEAAEKILRQVADSTGEANDYTSLLNLCATRKVADKNDCLSYTIGKLKSKSSNLVFGNAYTAAVDLDSIGRNKDAVYFYQIALKQYPQQTDAYTKTKDQIQQRITQLNG